MLGDAKLQAIVWTSNMPEAEKFYRDVLGLPLRGHSHGAAVFDVGGSDLRVSPVRSTAPSPHTVMGFAVTAIDEIMTKLAFRAVKFERFEGFNHDDAGLLTTPDGAKVAWLRDPDGNLLSIVEYNTK